MLYAFNTVAFGLLFAIWSKDGWINFFVKVALFTLAIMNGFYLAKHLGWVVRV